MPEVEVIGAFHQRIMVASELAWYPQETWQNVLCMYVGNRKEFGQLLFVLGLFYIQKLNPLSRL